MAVEVSANAFASNPVDAQNQGFDDLGKLEDILQQCAIDNGFTFDVCDIMDEDFEEGE